MEMHLLIDHSVRYIMPTASLTFTSSEESRYPI